MNFYCIFNDHNDLKIPHKNDITLVNISEFERNYCRLVWRTVKWESISGVAVCGVLSISDCLLCHILYGAVHITYKLQFALTCA